VCVGVRVYYDHLLSRFQICRHKDKGNETPASDNLVSRVSTAYTFVVDTSLCQSCSACELFTFLSSSQAKSSISSSSSSTDTEGISQSGSEDVNDLEYTHNMIP
jgi:hypothetical protein